jgi:hypothetical protein
MGAFYRVFELIFLEMSKQFFKFVGCKMYFLRWLTDVVYIYI